MRGGWGDFLCIYSGKNWVIKKQEQFKDCFQTRRISNTSEQFQLARTIASMRKRSFSTNSSAPDLSPVPHLPIYWIECNAQNRLHFTDAATNDDEQTNICDVALVPTQWHTTRTSIARFIAKWENKANACNVAIYERWKLSFPTAEGGDICSTTKNHFKKKYINNKLDLGLREAGGSKTKERLTTKQARHRCSLSRRNS